MSLILRSRVILITLLSLILRSRVILITLRYIRLTFACLCSLVIAQKSGTGGPDGIIVNEEQFKHMWEGKFDKRFRLLMTLFSYGIPLYFLSLGIGAMIKFYMSPVAAWLAFTVTLLFVGVWLKYHLSHMAYLTWRWGSEPLHPTPHPPNVYVVLALRVWQCIVH